MTLIVQDETGLVVDANAYVDVPFVDSYFSDRNEPAWAAKTTQEKEAAIIKATQYIDTRYTFDGDKLNPGQEISGKELQTTAFPRRDLFDHYDNNVIGIPTRLKNATAEAAFISLSQSLFLTVSVDDTGNVISSTKKKVGQIEKSVTYSTSGSTFNTTKSLPSVDFYLRDYLSAGNMVLRA